VLLGGFAIIAILLVAVVVIVINQNRPPDTVVERRGDGSPRTQGFEIGAPMAIMPTPSAQVFGRVNFSTTGALGDTLTVQLTNINQPPAGQVYAAWLQNTATAAYIRLGLISLDALGSGALSYQTPDGIALPSVYNRLIIAPDAPDADPASLQAAYIGEIPVEVSRALYDILGGGESEATEEAHEGDEYEVHPAAEAQGSLIDGALSEAGIAARHSGLAAGATSVGSMRVHAEHTLNALNGTTEDYDGNGRGENPGSGVGVMHYVNTMWEALNTAVQAPDSNYLVQSQAELIRICLANVSVWTQEVVTLETRILGAASLEAAQADLAESTTVAQRIVSGVDLNANGRVDPFEGECGLQQIIDYGVSVGNMNIFAADRSG
jgi:hypothetical protein